MNKEYNELLNKFNTIKNKGWIKSLSKHYGGIGITFEILIGNTPNELEFPDFKGIKIKTKRFNSKTRISLFNCTPSGPHCLETERLKNLYGYPDAKFKIYNVLNTTTNAVKKKKVGMNFYFKLFVNKEKEKIFLYIYDKKNQLIEKNVYWDFDELKQKLNRKLKYLSLIKAKSKKVYGDEYFKYDKINLYELYGFDRFIELIDTGIIQISFKIGIHKTKNKIGKIYDHGTSLSIYEKNLEMLYKIIK